MSQPTATIGSETFKILGLRLERYGSNGALAVTADLEWPDGEIEGRNPVSINLDHDDNGHVSSSLPPDEFYAKDFDERAATFKALVEAGWVELASVVRPRSGFCTYAHCRLTDKAVILSRR